MSKYHEITDKLGPLIKESSKYVPLDIATSVVPGMLYRNVNGAFREYDSFRGVEDNKMTRFIYNANTTLLEFISSYGVYDMLSTTTDNDNYNVVLGLFAFRAMWNVGFGLVKRMFEIENDKKQE